MFLKLQEYPLFYVLWVFANLIIWQELGSEELGKYFLIISAGTIIAFTFSLGMERSLKIISNKYPNNRPELLGNSLLLTMLWSGSLFFIIYFAIFLGDAEQFFFPDKEILLISTLSIIPICLSTYCIGILAGLNRQSFINLILTIRGVLVIFGLIYAAEYGVLTLELSLTIWVIIEFLISLILLNRLLININYNFKIRLINIPTYLKGSILSFLSNLFLIFLKISDVLILSFFIGFSNIGQYVLAVLAIGIVWRIPELWTMNSMDGSHFVSGNILISKMLRITFTVSLLSAFLLLLVGWFFSVLVYGSEFDTVYLLFLQLIPGGILLAQSRILLYEREVRSSHLGSIIITLLSFIILTIISIILIPKLLATGAALAFSISNIILGAILMFRYQKKSQSNWSDLFILKQGDLDISKLSLLSKT